MKKVMVIILSYIIFAFLLIYGIYAGQGDLPELLDGDGAGYLFCKTTVTFCKLLPALFASASLIACATAFANNADKAVFEYSSIMISHFKKMFVTIMVMTFLVLAGYEIAIPGALQSMKKAEMKPVLLKEYLTLGEKAYDNKNFVLAYEYSLQAQAISPLSKDVQHLKDRAEAKKDVQRNMIHRKKKVASTDIYYDLESKGFTVTQLIDKAKLAWSREKWFECHYWAELAVSVSDSRDVNVEDARRLSALAWKKLSETDGLRTTDENEKFALKKKAYMSLNSGNVLDAYYRFLYIEKRWDADVDPDVEVFLEIARKRVVEQCFFIDETENLDKFESANDVYFHINHSDGTRDVVYVRGVTPVQGTGGLIQYLRGLNIIKYDENGKMLQSMSVPYAKMMAQVTSVFSDEDKIRYDISDDFKTVPMLMLKSVDRNTSGVTSVPVFSGLESVDERDASFAVFSIPFEYFGIICDAGKGEMLMDLGSLFKFADVADEYGYSTEVFGSALLYRLSISLAMFCILMFTGLMAWNYRISDRNTFFKFRWIVIFPLSTAIFFFVIEFLFALLRLFNFALYGFGGTYSILIAMAIFAVLAFFLSMSFLRNKVD